MLPEIPLFEFDIEVIWYQNSFWLCEVCRLWNGETFVMEMVKIEEGIDGYVKEES